MRALSPILALALAASLALAGASGAATKKKAKDESPPTAKPDATLVAPDTTPLPQTYAAPTHPVEMAPIGSANSATSSALLAVANGGAPAAQAATPAPPPAPAPPPIAPPIPVAAPAPAAPPQAPVVAHAEVCLRAEAPRAARAEASVKLAVDLLLEDLCGGEVDRASLYARNIDALAHFTPQSERAAAGLSGARVDPETGELVNPPGGDVTGALAANGLAAGDAGVPPQMRRFAAELVLAAKAQPAAGKPTEPRKH